jgi:indole-3-glycerol phosphate synthase
MILDDIVRATRARVAGLPASFPDAGIKNTNKSLCRAIRGRETPNAVIAELKFASPSRGVIAADYPPSVLAKEFAGTGAVALSVLTEPRFFGGSTERLREVRSAVGIPILRKDFIIDRRQLDETNAMGADAVLLIAGLLGRDLPAFVDHALDLGLEPLVEVHDMDEAESAIMTSADLIGINNRNLKTMQIDLRTTARIAPFIRDHGGRLVVSESGITWPCDIRSLKRCCDAFLIGSSIMSARDRLKRLEGFVSA